MKLKKLFLLLFLPLIFLTGCKENEITKISKDLNTYTMELEYLDDHTLNGNLTFDYTNKTENNLDSLMFHLYPRSFRNGAKSSVVSTLNYNKCYYNGSSYGDIEIGKVKIADSDKDIIITGNDEDILELKLDDSLSPEENLQVYIEFKVTIPNINHRFGYGEDTINISNFYPILCMYENGNYNIESYHYNGDPFYSDIANYNVTIKAPSELKMASTGNLIETKTEESHNLYTIKASAVRDFAFIFSDKFNIVSDTINDIKVNYYYYSNQYPNECLKAGVQSIETFSNLFGDYPYSVINIVEADFVHGGMEYPNLVYISDAVDVQSDYINVIVHEVAHQWWYGVVGNNEFQYGWLDEGLTEYSTLLFYEENPEYNVNTKALIKNTTNSYATFVDVYTKVFDEVDTTMNRKLNEYNNESEYVYIAYVKGMLIFDSLKEILGKEKFLNCLKQYYDDNKFKIATPDNLINSFEKSSKTDLKSFFDSWINGKVKIMAIN